jgi:hypothetical protein
MIVPPKTVALDDEGGPSQITPAEWAVLERYHRGSQPDSWSQNDKLTLTSAFRKAYCYPRVSSDADISKIVKWIRETQAGTPHRSQTDLDLR